MMDSILKFFRSAWKFSVQKIQSAWAWVTRKSNLKPQCGLAKEAIEFQPDAIEIKNERLPLWARYSVIFALIFFAAAILWATFGKVDVVVKANGKLVSEQQNIVMKPVERAQIKKIHVKIGDIVEKDQLLFTFDPTISEADAKRLANEVEVLEAQYARLLAEFNGVPYKPAKNNAATKEQLAIFNQRADYYASRVRYFNESLEQLDASEKSKKDSLENQSKRLVTVRKLEEMFQGLSDKKAATLRELWNVQITRMEMEGNIDLIRNSLIELAHQRETAVSSRESFIHEWRNTISENLVSVGRELDRNRKELEQAKRIVSYVELRSPCRAMVHEIASFSEGSAVREAEALITLIPLDGEIRLEAEIEPRNIGKIELESEARIKLGAYPFQKYGTLSGKVLNLSENTLQKQSPTQGEDGTAKPAGMTYYRGICSVEGQLRGIGHDYRLIPGMECEVEIKTGRRRIIEYILYPLIKALDETAREP